MRPLGLKYKSRIATRDGRAYFVCARSGHGKIFRAFRSKKDAEEYRAVHDTVNHSRILRDLGIPQRDSASIPDVTLGDAFDEYIKHLERLEVDGLRDPGTVQYYRGIQGFLVEGFGHGAPLALIDRAAISVYTQWRRKRTDTRGARIVKELKALQTVARWKLGAPLPWTIPHAEIRPVKRQQKTVDPSQIRQFIEAMPPRSIERAYAVVKLHTGMREVELRNLTVGAVDLGKRTVSFLLHNKGGGAHELHVLPLTDDAVAVLRPLVNRKKRRVSEWVFTIQGRKLQYSSLRKRFIAASENAGISPPIESIGAFRHAAVTIATNTMGIEQVSRAIGHRSVRTTEGYLRGQASEMKRRRQVTEAIAKGLPVN